MNKIAEMLGYKEVTSIDGLDLSQWVKLGEIFLNDNKLSLNTTCLKEYRKNPRGRLYILTNNSKIVKIGGSQDKGGIEATISAYFRGDIGKTESMRNYAICKYMKQELLAGNRLEVYFLLLPIVEVEIPTFNGKKYKKEIPIDFHTVEKEFVDEYHKINGVYPDLNIQESNRTWKELGLSEGYVYKTN